MTIYDRVMFTGFFLLVMVETEQERLIVAVVCAVAWAWSFLYSHEPKIDKVLNKLHRKLKETKPTKVQVRGPVQKVTAEPGTPDVFIVHNAKDEHEAASEVLGSKGIILGGQHPHHRDYLVTSWGSLTLKDGLYEVTVNYRRADDV